MRGFASPGQAATQLAGDSCHHTYRKPFIFEHRSLFDMDFQVAGKTAGVECRDRATNSVPLHCSDDFRQSQSIPIRHRQLFRRQQPTKGFAANISILKPDTFFVTESGYGQRKWQDYIGRSHDIDRFNRQHHTERSVESAGISHTVQV